MPNISSRNQNFFLGLVLGFSCVLVQGQALHNPLYFDDIFVLRNNHWIDVLQAPYAWFGSYFIDSNRIFAGYRPILMLSFWLNAQLFGKSEESFRIINILLHISNSLLLFAFVRSLVTGAHRNAVGWGAAFLFCFHPAQTLAMNLIWKRSTLLETTFLFTSLLLHVRERKRGSYRLWMIALQCLIFFLALMTKETALIYPAIFLTIDVLFFRREALADRWRSVIFYIASNVMAVAFYFFRFQVVEGWMSGRFRLLQHRHSWSFESYFRTSLETLPRYFELWLLPNPRIVDDPSPVAAFPWQGFILTALILFLSFLIALRFRKRPLILFSIATVWISLGPTAGFKPVYFVMDQIRLYLPLAALSILISEGAFNLVRPCIEINWKGTKSLPWPAILITTITIAYAARSFLENRRYAIPVLAWYDVVTTYPESNVAWGELGVALQDTENYAKAAKAFEKAAIIEPSNLSYKILAQQNHLRAGGSREVARDWLAHAPTRDLSSPDAASLAHLASLAGDFDRARDIILQALWLNSTYQPGYVELGVALLGLKQTEKARKAFERAAELLPEDPLAAKGLAMTVKSKSP